MAYSATRVFFGSKKMIRVESPDQPIMLGCSSKVGGRARGFTSVLASSMIRSSPAQRGGAEEGGKAIYPPSGGEWGEASEAPGAADAFIVGGSTSRPEMV